MITIAFFSPRLSHFHLTHHILGLRRHSGTLAQARALYPEHLMLSGAARIHAGLIAVLVLGAVGLAAVAIWGAGVQGGSCPQYTPPGWVVGVVVGLAVVVLAVVLAGSLNVEDSET